MSGIQRFDQAHWGMTMDDEHGDYVLYGDHKSAVDGLEAEIARLRAEVDANMVDAQRYRWLRDSAPSANVRYPCPYQYDPNGFHPKPITSGLDAEVDEAMGADA